jgi:hypothetical protein
VKKSPAKEREPLSPAWLPSAGLGESRATLHVFDRYEPMTAEYTEGYGPRSGGSHSAIIYKCTETGAERRWGYV